MTPDIKFYLSVEAKRSSHRWLPRLHLVEATKELLLGRASMPIQPFENFKRTKKLISVESETIEQRNDGYQEPRANRLPSQTSFNWMDGCWSLQLDGWLLMGVVGDAGAVGVARGSAPAGAAGHLLPLPPAKLDGCHHHTAALQTSSQV